MAARYNRSIALGIAEERTPLARNEVQVWHADVASAFHESLVALLEPGEREAIGRHKLEQDRRERIVARVGLRIALSRCADVAPDEWRFETSRNGRPVLVPRPGVAPLRFNVSHAGGVVALAVANDRAVGVDVEDSRREGIEPEELAAYLADDERASIAELPAEWRRERFLRLWTLKEAYAKARSLGLEFPFSRISFDLEPSGAPRVRFDGVDDPGGWSFMQWSVAPHHVLSAAARATAGPVEFRFRELRLQSE